MSIIWVFLFPNSFTHIPAFFISSYLLSFTCIWSISPPSSPNIFYIFIYSLFLYLIFLFLSIYLFFPNVPFNFFESFIVARCQAARRDTVIQQLRDNWNFSVDPWRFQVRATLHPCWPNLATTNWVGVNTLKLVLIDEKCATFNVNIPCVIVLSTLSNVTLLTA